MVHDKELTLLLLLLLLLLSLSLSTWHGLRLVGLEGVYLPGWMCTPARPLLVGDLFAVPLEQSIVLSTIV